MFEDYTYVRADIKGKESNVVSVIQAFTNVYQGGTDGQRRIRLPKMKRELHACVDYVQDHLPNGVDRVDGDCIEPLLKDELNTRIEMLVEKEVIELQ